MGTFVSKEGVWYPAKEKVALKNVGKKDLVYKGVVIKPGEPFIYEGPDRVAVDELKKSGEETFGHDFRSEPEFLQAVRNMGFNTVDEYLKHIGYDQEKELKKFEDKASSVQAHEVPKPVDEIYIPAGGKDTSGNKEADIIGGFGDQRIRSADELRKPKGK